MTTKPKKEFMYSDGESLQEKVCGIHMALDFVSKESKKLGLKYTANLAGAAAYSALIEITQIVSGEDSEDLNRHHPFEQ